MALQKETKIDITGKYIRGSVVKGKYKTTDVVLVDGRQMKIGLSGNIIREIIEELKELADVVDANQIAEMLADSDDSKCLEDPLDSIISEWDSL